MKKFISTILFFITLCFSLSAFADKFGEDKMPLPKGLDWRWTPQHFEKYCVSRDIKSTYYIDNSHSFYTTAYCTSVDKNSTIIASWSSSMRVEEFAVIKSYSSITEAYYAAEGEYIAVINKYSGTVFVDGEMSFETNDEMYAVFFTSTTAIRHYNHQYH